MKQVCFLVCLAIGLSAAASAQVGGEIVGRSSHPRGIAGDGRPPQPSGGGRPATVPENAAVRQGTAQGAQAVQASPAGTQSASESVNISGTTRIDARSSDAKAAAIGHKNAAGNRVGTVGGKQD